MADWQEAVQASVIALIFALMVAKLVSVVISFRGDNLRVEREAPEKELLDFEAEEEEEEEVAAAGESSSSDEELENWHAEEDVGSEDKVFENMEDKAAGCSEEAEPPTVGGEGGEGEPKSRSGDMGLHPFVEEQTKINLNSAVEEEEQKKAEAKADEVRAEEGSLEAKVEGEEKKSKIAGEVLGEVISDSDEWEGVESSELEEKFGAAATFVAIQAVGPGLKIPNETQLILYGLYKLATEGPCTTPQPSAYKLSARAKWNAWQKLGSIGQEEAMHRYIAVVSEISPSWAQGTHKTEEPAGASTQGDGSQRGGIGPVFSSLAATDDGVEDEGTLEAIHICATEGNLAGLQQQLEDGIPVDLKDSGGRTALHWAADRGHLHAVELLLAKGAQIHAKDAEGQTALHYATTCEQEEVAKYLVNNGADISKEDNDGASPLSSRPANWTWMVGTT